MFWYCSDTIKATHLWIATSLLLLIGCRHREKLPEDNPAYFDAVFHQMDSLNLSRDDAFRYLDSVYSQFPHPGIMDKVRRYDYKGQYFFYQAHDLPNAMRYVDSCLWLLSSKEAQTRYSRQYAKCLIDKAETYQWEGNYENAFFYYRKGLEAIRDFGDSCSMAEYTQRIGMASYRAGRFGDARNLFELAIRQFAACRPHFRSFAYQQQDLDNIGQCYSSVSRWDSAKFYFDSTLRFLDSESGPFVKDSSHRAYIETAKGVVYGNLGDYFLHVGDTAKAWTNYNASIAINMRPLHDSGNALTVLVKAARLHLSQARLNDAKRTLTEVRSILDHRPNPEMDLAWQRLHAEWLARSGKAYDAWAALDAWTVRKDSLKSAGVTMPSVDVPGELVHLEDKYTIELLRQRDHVKTVYLLLAMPILLLLGVIVLLIKKGATRSKVYIAQLNRLNKALRTENRQTQTAINALNEDQAMYLRSLKTIAHDLRNPVGAISSAIQMLQQQPLLDDQSRTMLNLMRQAADQSLHLVGGIMNLDMPMGQLNLKMETIDLARLLETCVDTLQFKAAEKKQAIHLDAEPITLLADHDKLWRVIINLLDNSIKFSPEQGDITIRLQRIDDKAIISVSDKGIGIPKGIEDKLFTVDGGARRRGTAGEASFGLGLAIVSQIIRAHGGTISVQSEEHQGTTFRIELRASAA